MIDLALFCLIMSTLLMVTRLVVTNIGLKMTVDEGDCPDAYVDVKWNKIGLAICNYGSLGFNIFAMVLIIIVICSL